MLLDAVSRLHVRWYCLQSLHANTACQGEGPMTDTIVMDCRRTVHARKCGLSGPTYRVNVVFLARLCETPHQPSYHNSLSQVTR